MKRLLTFLGLLLATPLAALCFIFLWLVAVVGVLVGTHNVRLRDGGGAADSISVTIGRKRR